MGRFGQFLLQEGKLLPSQLGKVMEMQQLVGGRVGTNILELGLMEEQDLLDALGRFRQRRTVSPVELRQISPEVLRLVPPKIAQRHGLIPVERRGNTLTVAAMDSVDPLVEDELGYLTSCLVRTVLCLELRLYWALQKYYRVPQPTRMGGLTRRLDGQVKKAAGPQSAQPQSVQPQSARSETHIATPPAAIQPAAAQSPAKQPPAKQPPAKQPPAKQPPAKQLPTTQPPATPDAVPPRRPQVRATAPLPHEQPRQQESPPTAPPEVRYIELDEDTKQRIYTVDPASQTPAARLDAAAEELQTASIRDEIGDVLLDYCKPYIARRLLLIQRKKEIVGWRGEGAGIEIDKVRAISAAADEPSVFLTLQQGTDFWLGPLAPLQAHSSLNDALGGQPPKACLVLPITLRKRVVCYLYGDNGDEGVSAAPLAEIRRLTTKAGVAFEVCILQNKIRTL